LRRRGSKHRRRRRVRAASKGDVAAVNTSSLEPEHGESTPDTGPERRKGKGGGRVRHRGRGRDQLETEEPPETVTAAAMHLVTAMHGAARAEGSLELGCAFGAAFALVMLVVCSCCRRAHVSA